MLLKLDCEGHEASALAGLKYFLRDKRPPIYFELMGYGHLEDGSYPTAYFGSLSDDEIRRLIAARRENCMSMDSLLTDYRLSLVTESGLRPIPQLADCLPGRGEMNFYAEPIDD